ncbi:MAG: pimeloyl-ACP methyl ester carboxylesterase [Ilumatobacter sp.]|jgi:pimeloyl-ACP methyl ester carboxylesterase
MPRAVLPTGIELEYATHGNPEDPTLLLVCGYTSQIDGWDPGLAEAFVAQGLHVVRYDNRDVGLSSKLVGVIDPMTVIQAVIAGGPAPEVPYTLTDMAADGIGLLDHLDIGRAHIAGMSMGGMIVQTMAIEHPDRVISLTSVMSTTGNPKVGQAADEARDALLAAAPMDRVAFIEAASRYAVWASKRYLDLDSMKERAANDFDRSFYPQGSTRQLAAIYASGERTAGLAKLDVPTLVIHGRDDTLITPSGGEATAAAISGSQYLLLADMGHDIPVPLWPIFAEAIGGHVRVAESA